MRSLIRAATAAPSLRNAQPWRFRYLSDSASLQVRAALDRCLPHDDPHGRSLHLGCAAAVFNLRVAAAHAALLPLTRLLPDAYDPRLLATVLLERPRGADEVGHVAELAALYPAIRRRHTSREPFRDEPLPGPVRAELREAALEEGAGLSFPDPWQAHALLEQARDAEDHGITDPEAHGEVALLGTADDRPADWLHAGQALERVLLVAAGHGVSAALTPHTGEWSEPHAPERPHLLLRFGYGPRAPATPRLPVSQVLDIA